MKTNLKITRILLSLSCLALLPSCIDSGKSRKVNISGKAILSSNATAPAKAEELALAAEELLAAQGFDEAYKLVNAALQQDPTNLRAGFLKMGLELLVLQKGIHNRVSPIAHQRTDTAIKFKKSVAAQTEKNDPLLNYLLDATPNITSEKQLQEHIDDTLSALEKSYAFLKQRKNEQLTLRTTSLMLTDTAERFAYACEIKETDDLSYALTCPSNEILTKVTLNLADFETLQDMVVQYIVSIAVNNAYDLTGLIEVAKNVENQSPSDAQYIVNELMKKQNLGKLRTTQRLTLMKSLGIDLVLSFNWLIANQKTLCGKNDRNYKNRIGMLFASGVCVYPNFLGPLVASFENNLNGKSIPQMHLEQRGLKYDSPFDVMTILNQPIPDLKAIGPIKVDRCGRVSHVTDQKAGGLLPFADADKVMALRNKPCPK